MEIPIPTIRTSRLVLRPLEERDVEPLFAILRDPDVVRFIGDRQVPTREEVWRAVAGWLGHWALRGYGQWAVDEQASGRLIGRIGIINPADWPGPEVGYLLGKEFWGRGYATEGAQAAMDWGFEEGGFDELISLIDPANAASIGVATKLGETLQREIELRGHRVQVYGISREAWAEGRRPASPRP
jgi:RimJ/RimL family protein N-acetyltransferase